LPAQFKFNAASDYYSANAFQPEDKVNGFNREILRHLRKNQLIKEQ
jgi:hypothetical protein